MALPQQATLFDGNSGAGTYPTPSREGEGAYRSLQLLCWTTDRERHAKKRIIQRGNIPRKKFFKKERAFIDGKTGRKGTAQGLSP